MSSITGLSSPPITNLFSNSGMDIEGIITSLIAAETGPINLLRNKQAQIKSQQSAYTAVQTKVQTLLDKIKLLTKRELLTGTSLFDSMKGASTDESIATATATGSAASQILNLEVKSLPTGTRAVSTGSVGKMMTGTTTLSELGLSDGSFTFFVDGVAQTVNVTSGQTVQSVLDDIQAQSGGKITAASVDGTSNKITFSYTAGANVSFGAAAGDTSGFLSKVGLLTALNDTGTNTITASKPVSLIALGQDVSDPASNLNVPVTDGTFTINGVTFDTTGKSLGEIITEINNNADAKVTANFNMAANKLELTAKTTGSTYINMADGTGNFLTAMGLITAGDTTSSQTPGSNAEFVLNGVTMYSTTATVDETVTGIAGVTLNLKKAAVGSTIQINVGRDSEKITTAIQDVITAYNEAITYIDQQTDAENKGVLAGESRLKALRNQLRSLFAQSVPGLSGTAYDSLQQVGITTGPVQSGGSAVVNVALQFDTEKFKAALETSPDLINKLFIARDLVATDPGDQNMDGIFTQIQNLLSDRIYKDANGNDAYGALYNGGEEKSGLFASYQTSSAKRLDSLDESILRAQERLENKEAMLRKQFTAMDQLIGKYQAQSAAVTNLINQLNSGKS